MRYLIALLSLSASLAAYDSLDSDYSYEPLSTGQSNELELAYMSPFSDNFTIGRTDGEWKNADRYELAWNMRVPSYGSRWDGWGGVYTFYEERKWDANTGSGTLDYSAYGVGLEGGASFHFFDRSRGGSFDSNVIAIWPCRLGSR